MSWVYIGFIDVINCTFKAIIRVSVCHFKISTCFCECDCVSRRFPLNFDVRSNLCRAGAGRLVLNIGLLVSVLPHGDAVFIADGVACTDNRGLLLRQRVCRDCQRIAVAGNIKACLLKIEQIQHAVGIGNSGRVLTVYKLQIDFLCIAAVAAFACKGRDDFRA